VFAGITAEEFVEPGAPPGQGKGQGGKGANSLNVPTQNMPSRLQKFRDALAGLVGTAEENVDVFSVQDVPGEERMVYVMYAAHGSPYYSPARLSGVVWANKDQVRTTAPPG